MSLADQKGRIGVFDHDGYSLLALITGEKKEKFLAFSERGREVELIPQRLQLLSPYKAAALASTSSERLKALQDIRQRAEILELPIPIGELWELAASNERDYELTELSELLFSSPGPVEEFSLRLKLAADKVYFKRNQNYFVPRPIDTVTELLSAERTRLEAEQTKADFVIVLAKRVQDTSITDAPEEKYAPFVRLLRKAASLAALGPNETREVQYLLEQVNAKVKIELPQSFGRAATKVLRAANLIAGNFNPVLERSELRKQFSEETRDAAAAFDAATQAEGNKALNREGRLDLRELHVVTVDDASTKDIDDALSFVDLGDGRWQVGIHITDVGSLIDPGSLLAKEAAARATSVYLPEVKLHMFPRAVSQGALSLNPGEERPAISCLFTINADGSITDEKIARTLITSKGKLTYDELDKELLAKNSRYQRLYDFCLAQEQRRLDAGAFRVTKPEISLDVGEGGQVSLFTFDEHSPGRHVIAELAIFANRSFANFAASKNLAYIFRSQAKPAPMPQIQEMEEGPAKHFLFRINLPRSITSTKAAPHAGLGLDCYGQSTSPIRRYADLVNQWQMGAELSGKSTALSAAHIESLMRELETPLSRAQVTTKDSRRYWLLRYIEQKGLRSLSGTVVRIDGKIPLIELDEVGFINAFRSKGKPVLNQKIIVTVKELSALDDMLKLDA